MIFIQARVLKFLLQLSYMGRKLCAKGVFLLLVLKVLRLRLGVIDRSKSILSPVKFQPVVMQLQVGKPSIVDYFLDLLVGEAEEHILGLEVGVDDPTDAVEKV